MRELLKEAKLPTIEDGNTYEIAYGAYGIEVHATVTWWSGRGSKRKLSYGTTGTPVVRFELFIDRWGFEEVDGDHDADDEIPRTLAKRLKLNPKKLWWADPSWQPRGRGQWSRTLSYSGKIHAKED